MPSIRKTSIRKTRALSGLSIVGLALAVTGCIALLGQHSDAVGAEALIGSTWMTMTVDDVSVPVDVESTLSFPSEQGITGNGGCNAFSATLNVAANELDIGPISRGERVCAPDVMAAEQRYLGALQTVRSFRGTDLFLYLSDEVGRQRISLSRVPAPAAPAAETR